MAFLPAVQIIFMLVFIELVMSIDNAAILGAKAAALPAEKRPPGFLQKKMFRSLGEQRHAALQVGILGAFFFRFVLLALATYIAQNIWLRTIGSVYLVYLGLEYFKETHLFPHDDAKDGEEESLTSRLGIGWIFTPFAWFFSIIGVTWLIRHVFSDDFWKTVLIVELLDIAFSLDNVVAAVAMAPNHLGIVMIGVGAGIVGVRFAAVIFQKLMEWEPSIKEAAYLLLIVIGGELIVKDWLDIEIHETMKFVITVSVMVGTVIVARLWRRYHPHVFHGEPVRVSITPHGRVRRGYVEIRPDGTRSFFLQIGRPNTRQFRINAGILVDYSLSMVHQHMVGFPIRLWHAVMGWLLGPDWAQSDLRTPFEHFIKKLAHALTGYDDDREVEVILFNHEGPDTTHSLGRLNQDDLEVIEINEDEVGPEGEETVLLPALESMYSILSSQSGVDYVFILVHTDGHFLDLDKIISWATESAAKMVQGSMVPTKVVLVVPGHEHHDILDKLNHIQTEGGYDIFDVVHAPDLMSGHVPVETIFEEQLVPAYVSEVTSKMITYPTRKDMIIRLEDLEKGKVHTITGEIPSGITYLRVVYGGQKTVICLPK